MVSTAGTHIYPNERVKKIIAAIPRGHMHLRMAIVLDDQVIVFHEATVAAIVRAYVNVVLHPSRRGVVLEGRFMRSSERKHGYAKYQLLEVDGEEYAVDYITSILSTSWREED